jgi:type I restriction enzyme M protein
MVREALRERFLETLAACGGSAGNGRLRDELGWQEDTYWSVHAALIEEGSVLAGRGRGGSVALANGRSPAAAAPATIAREPAITIDRPPAKPDRRKAGNGGSSFEQTFKNIDDVLWKEAGCTTELDYTEQTSWMLFLKYLDDLEKERELRAQVDGKRYSYIIDPAYRWSAWAAPKTPDGAFDHNNALTGPDLIDFVNTKLFPYLQGFRTRAQSADTIEYKISEIFGEIPNKFRSGYSLRDALELVDALRFRSQAERHELSALYEDKIRRMGNAGRNGGEYYTPRPLIRAMVRVVQPRIGERVYDGACGSGGFLCEAFEYMGAQSGLSTSDAKTLQERTFYGKEKKSLAYVLAIMNMILHGIEAPNIVHTNTLAENVSDLQEKDRFEVILANPPFGGKERPEVQQNFPIRTGETAFLFLQHFIKSLKAGGRAGVVIKNTFLSNTDNAAVSLRRELLSACNLHTVLDLPGGTFQGAGVKTVVLFFEKGAPTRTIWYYQLDPRRSLGKTNALNDDDFAEFDRLQPGFANSVNSWALDAAVIDSATCDLSVKNPNNVEVSALRDPREIAAEIAALDAESANVLRTILALL